MSEIEENMPDRVFESFLEKTIFITGGTGLLGKVIIERLLRIFDVKKIYLLIRRKKNKDEEERLREIFLNPLFDKVRQLKGEKVFEKCILIAGDITLENMDITAENRIILQDEVEYVFHSAATVRFDETLKRALDINTCGTQRMLELAKEMKKLQIFIHISTTFCHPEEKVLYEKVYTPPNNPKRVMDMVNWMKEDQLNAITPVILEDMPNTYTFSKALAEQLVADEMEKLPVIIVRPSIVVPIWKEPIEGWIDNTNGPMGFLIAGGKGILRSMYGNPDIIADFIFVDIAADGIFCIVAYSEANGLPERVFHVCISDDIKMKWGRVIELSRTIAMNEVPFDTILWSPGGKIRTFKISHMLAVIFYHYLPALLVDVLAFCLGYKPFLWKIQKRISSNMEMLDYYTSNEWKFKNNNLWSIRRWLNVKERVSYTIFTDDFNERDYFTKCIYAARKYILKEPIENLPKARRRMTVMYWLDKVVNIAFKIFLLFLFYKYVLVRCFNF